MLYLASASPRRHEILCQLDIAHEILLVPAPAGEDEPMHSGESAQAYTQRTTLEKLERARSWIQEQSLSLQRPVLCADTCVALDGKVLGKPDTVAQVRSFMRQLSGRSHWVYTAQALWHKGQVRTSLSANQVHFKELDDAEIEAYCATDEPFGKAGGYGIQGRASYFIERLDGRYSAVMGLDIHDLYQLLTQAGLRQLCF